MPFFSAPGSGLSVSARLKISWKAPLLVLCERPLSSSLLIPEGMVAKLLRDTTGGICAHKTPPERIQAQKQNSIFFCIYISLCFSILTMLHKPSLLKNKLLSSWASKKTQFQMIVCLVFGWIHVSEMCISVCSQHPADVRYSKINGTLQENGQKWLYSMNITDSDFIFSLKQMEKCQKFMILFQSLFFLFF